MWLNPVITIFRKFVFSLHDLGIFPTTRKIRLFIRWKCYLLFMGIREKFRKHERMNTYADIMKLPQELIPLVSFVIPVYDRTDKLIRAVNSALNQTYPKIEVILVLDGSPSETVKTALQLSFDPRVRLFSYDDNSGTAVRGRNRGILESNGEFIAFLDSDDSAHTNRIADSLPPLFYRQADVVYGGYQLVVNRKNSKRKTTKREKIFSPDLNKRMLRQHCVPCQSTVMLRKSLFLKSGLLKPQIKYREDHELWLRLLNDGAVFKSIKKILVDLELHNENNELNFLKDSIYWHKFILKEFKKPGPPYTLLNQSAGNLNYRDV